MMQVVKNVPYYLFKLMFLICIISTSAALGTTKKDYVLISEDFPIKTDFNFVPNDARLLFIGTVEGGKLSPEQEKIFDKVVILNEFNFNAVLTAIKNNVKDYSNTRLLVNDDTIFKTVARVREVLNIPGATLHAILPFCDKIESKKRLQGSKVNYPKFIYFDYNAYQTDPKKYLNEICKELSFPILAKPTNLAGSIGLKKIESRLELEDWCKSNDLNKWESSYGRKIEFELEEFVQTKNADFFHCDSIIKDGKVIFTQVCRYMNPQMQVVQGDHMGSIPYSPHEKGYKELTNLPNMVIQAFSRYDHIPDGVMHMEAFYDRQLDKVTFIETQLRAPGMDTRKMHRIHLGIDIVEIDFKLQMGLPIGPIPTIKGPYAMWVCIPTHEGIIQELILPTVKGKIHEIVYPIREGDRTTLSSSLLMSNQTALKVCISNVNYTELLEDFEYFKKFQPFILKDK